MNKIALLGAGGKMGLRLARNLQGSKFEVAHVELSQAGQERLKTTLGIDCVEQEGALQEAGIVILAVPDRLIGEVAHAIVRQLRPGAVIIVLDAAAPYAGRMPHRADVSYFVAHPCHPPLFSEETDPEAQRDYFGGIKAPQSIVCALVQGPDEDYALAEEVAKAIFAPVACSHRCTLENLAVLEPAMSETVAATFCVALKEAMDAAVAKGVPPAAARDFMLGHLNIELSIVFGVFPGRFSDGALKAIEDAKPLIFRQGWLDQVFDLQAVRASTEAICDAKVT